MTCCRLGHGGAIDGDLEDVREDRSGDVIVSGGTNSVDHLDKFQYEVLVNIMAAVELKMTTKNI